MSLSSSPIGATPMSQTPGSLPSGREYPYLIQQGVKLKIASVRVRIMRPITGTGPKIRGMQADGMNVPERTLNLVSGDLYEATNIEVATAFPANLTAFHPSFQIDWEVSRDGSTWESAGSSRNPIYVCLADPNSPPVSTVAVFRTVVHLACSNAGATNRNEAVVKTWALFAGRNVTDWTGQRPLYYYRPGTSFALSENPTTVAGLLLVGSSECVGWSHLIQDCFTINGVGVNSFNQGSSSYTLARSSLGVSSFFWVAWWAQMSPLEEWFYFEGPASDMIPYPPDGRYGHYDNGANALFKNQPTIPGQNSGLDAPSQKVFGNHQFIRYTADGTGAVTYYDPSYGTTYTDAADFQSQALVGFGNEAQKWPSDNNFQKLRLKYKPVGSVVLMPWW